MKSMKSNALRKGKAFDLVHPVGKGKSMVSHRLLEGLPFMLFMVNLTSFWSSNCGI